MKENVREKFIPSRSRVFKELFYLRQGDLSVIEYKLKCEELVFECDFKIRHLPTIYMFYNKFRPDFKRELILYVMKSVKEMFLLALELKLSTFKTRERCSTCERYRYNAYECPSIKCTKCGEFKHYDYQRPSVSQHTDNMQIDDIDNSRIIEDVHITSEVTSGVDELVKTSTPTLDETHIHKENINDIQDVQVESSTPTSDDIDVSEDDTNDSEHVSVESSMPGC